MIPAGPERDRLICWAKLKEVPINERRPRCTKCEPDCDIYNFYSTNITAAMRIDFPPHAIKLTQDRCHITWSEDIYTVHRKNRNDAEVTADLRSGAWLKWKAARKEDEVSA